MVTTTSNSTSVNARPVRRGGRCRPPAGVSDKADDISSPCVGRCANPAPRHRAMIAGRNRRFSRPGTGGGGPECPHRPDHARKGTASRGLCHRDGSGWIRTTVGVRRQIYSLLPLSTRAHSQVILRTASRPGRPCAADRPQWLPAKPAEGFEPATPALQKPCSTVELRWRRERPCGETPGHIRRNRPRGVRAFGHYTTAGVSAGTRRKSDNSSADTRRRLCGCPEGRRRARVRRCEQAGRRPC